MKNKFGYIMLLLAVLLAGTAAYFSVLGLSQLFAGASLAVIIMASVLEVGKIVITTALHTYWSELNKSLKIYLTIAVGILMIITSAGIYGFLSNAYQKTANELEVHDGEINILMTKKESFQLTIDENKKLIADKVNEKEETGNRLNKRISNIDFTKGGQSRRADIATNEGNKRLGVIGVEIDVLNAKNSSLLDSVNKYNVMVLELKSNSKIAGEVGPLKYISELTGAPMANIVNYLILLLIFVFDPLAIALVLATNRIFELNGQQTPLEPKPTNSLKEEESEEEYEEDTDNDDFDDYFDDFPEIIETKHIWSKVKELREEGILESPTEDDIENEPTALAFTPYEIEGVVELPEEIVEESVDIVIEEIVELPNNNVNERGFSVNIPNRREKNTIQRIGSNKEIRGGNDDKIYFNRGN
jgi:hypothetical protein